MSPLLNYEEVVRFFAGRNRHLHTDPLKSVLYNDNNPLLNQQRHDFEIQFIRELINLSKYKSVLDLGCGTGRLLELFKEDVEYTGVDQNLNFINFARKQHQSKNVNFYCKNVLNLEKSEIKNFNLILISGLAMYLNDSDLEQFFDKLTNCSNSFTLIWRESVSKTSRINLTNHFSSELQQTYQAIYRTKEYYHELLGQFNFKLTYSNILYPEKLRIRDETTNWLMIAEI